MFRHAKIDFQQKGTAFAFAVFRNGQYDEVGASRAFSGPIQPSSAAADRLVSYSVKFGVGENDNRPMTLSFFNFQLNRLC